MAGKLFAIGDVHGCSTELRQLLSRLPLTPDSTVVFLGDYIDRGPDSRGVVETILELRKMCNVVCLRGNHELLLDAFLQAPDSPDAALFIYSGGSATLASYGDDTGEFRIPEEHLEFFRDLRLFYDHEDYFFVHAGVPEVPLDQIDEEAHGPTMVWIRDRFLRGTFTWSKTIVHGHSPIDDVEISERRINVDTACVYGGSLSAIQLPECEVFSVARAQPAPEAVLRDKRSRRQAVRFRATVPVWVMIDGEEFEFETADYSPRGMFIRDVSAEDRQLLEAGDQVLCRVGDDDGNAVLIDGRVARVVEQDGVWYGVEVPEGGSRDLPHVIGTQDDD